MNHRSLIKDTPEKGTWQDKIKEYSLWMMNHNVSHEDVSNWLKQFLGMVSSSKYHSTVDEKIIIFEKHSLSMKTRLTSKCLSGPFFRHCFT